MTRFQTTKDRLIGKEGECKVTHIPRNSGSCLHRFVFHSGESILNTRWRWLWVVLLLTFPTLWMVFAGIYYALALWHDDVISDDQKSNLTTCVENLRSFTAAILFSLETEERIGFGFRYPNEICNSVLAIVPLQTVLGKIVLATICGSVFARFLRPHERCKALLFSKTAVITHHAGSVSRCLMFRLGDLDDRQLYSITYRLFYVDKNKNPEEMISMRVQENGDLFLLPALVRHEIDHYSPLFSLTREDLKTANFEVIVVVEGVIETSGISLQVRTSYLPEEIQWGYGFDPLPMYDSKDKHKTVRIQYSKFDKTSTVMMSNESVNNLTKMIPYEHRNHYTD